MRERKEERLDRINQRMEDLTREVYETTEAIKARDEIREERLNEGIELAKNKANEVKESVKAYTDQIAAKGNESLNKIKESLEEVKAKIADKKEEYDKEKMERYIERQLDYVDECIELSLYLLAEAKLSFFEALATSIDYEEKYGE